MCLSAILSYLCFYLNYVSTGSFDEATSKMRVRKNSKPQKKKSKAEKVETAEANQKVNEASSSANLKRKSSTDASLHFMTHYKNQQGD